MANAANSPANESVLINAKVFTADPTHVFFAIYQAETRKGRLGVLNPDERMPRTAMLEAYSCNGARALGLADLIASIVPGKQADLVVLDRDILTVPAEEMREAKVLRTIFAGRTVYRSHPE